MVYCKDCKHCVIPETGLEYARCRATFNDMLPTQDLVSGAPIPEIKRMSFCEHVRLEHGLCGPNARMFVAKEVAP